MNTPSSGSYLNFACACRGVSTTTWTSVLEANAGSARRSAILLFGGLGRHQRRRHGLDADVADAAEYDCFHEMLRKSWKLLLAFRGGLLATLATAFARGCLGRLLAVAGAALLAAAAFLVGGSPGARLGFLRRHAALLVALGDLLSLALLLACVGPLAAACHAATSSLRHGKNNERMNVLRAEG